MITPPVLLLVAWIGLPGLRVTGEKGVASGRDGGSKTGLDASLVENNE